MNNLVRLRNDSDYYGEFGKQWLSNSDISTLLECPNTFGQPKETTKQMMDGKLFHQLILEPEKASEYPTIDVSSRNTKAYREFLDNNGFEHAFLLQEVNELKKLAAVMTSNMSFYDIIFADGCEYEVPATGELFGVPWKGKCDINHPDFIVDIKTTSDINKFKYSARNYYYDSQAYIYSNLFGKPLMFLVIDKETQQLGIFHTSPDFIAGGELRVKDAVAVYNTYFNQKTKTTDIKQHFIESIL